MARGWTGVGPAERSDRHLFACSNPNCYRRLTFKTIEEAYLDEANHKCPWGIDLKVAWSVTKTLVEQMWDKLDTEMDWIKGHHDPETQAWTFDPESGPRKVRARAIAECIQIFMTPFFETANEVAAEAARRHKARVEGDKEYETPGLGSRRYEGAVRQSEQHASAAEGWYQSPDGGYTSNPERAGEKAVRTRGRSTSTGQVDITKLTEQEQTAIKAAHEQMPTVFTPTVLAKQYGVSVAVVNAVISA